MFIYVTGDASYAPCMSTPLVYYVYTIQAIIMKLCVLCALL